MVSILERTFLMNGNSVLFVEPGGASNTFSKFMSIPLLGPVYLATMARKAGYDSRVINENIIKRRIFDDELAGADVLCVSSLTSTVDRGKEIATRYSELRKECGLPARSIIGGIHASMLPDDVSPYFDQVVVGEGEEIILDLLSGKLEGKVIKGRPLEDLDKVPMPDFSLVKGWKDGRIWPVMTSRGCPYDCNFCSVTEMFGRGYRKQSPQRVLDEVMRYKDGYVFFVDDNFAADIKRSDAILDLMGERGFKNSWTTQVRTNVTKKPEFVAKMRDRGCKWVYVGLESINPESLLDMQKGQTVEDIRKAMSVFHENGVRVHGMFMFGSDPDKMDVFKTTTAFARECRIDTAQFNVLTPLPGTRLFNRIVSEGRLLHRKWQYYDGLHVVFSPKHMSPRELQEGMMSCFSDFYTYTRAFGDALETGIKMIGAAGKRAMSIPARRPTVSGTVLKIAGRGMVRQWIRENGGYLVQLGKNSR